jgi:molybdenum cofactor cytidylyltransferase
MRSIGAVILAAGASTRLGVPKQLVKIGTENLLERTVRVATEAACSPVVVVLGASAELIQEKSNLSEVQVVFNEGWTEGMASSIRIGVKALHGVEGAVIMTCDMPAVTSSHILALTESGGITGTSYSGYHGVPAYLPKSIFSALMALQGDTGAKDFLRMAPLIELRHGELNIDTEEDLKIARQRFGGRTYEPT